jgi:hypothetical protein
MPIAGSELWMRGDRLGLAGQKMTADCVVAVQFEPQGYRQTAGNLKRQPATTN